VLVCLGPWFVYFCVRKCLKRRHHSGWKASLGRGAIVLIAFAITLVVVVSITFKASYSSFSVLVGVLAIGVEQYIEVMRKWVLDPFEQWLNRRFESTH
jgi:hypothetical protein